MLDEIVAKANPRAVQGFAHKVKNAGKDSSEREGNWAKSTLENLVHYSARFKSNLIGTPKQIAERNLALKNAGADLIVLRLLHFHDEVEFFGRHVTPTAGPPMEDHGGNVF